MSANHPVLDMWILATAPGREPISVHGEAILMDHDLGDAFDQLAAALVPELRQRVTGESA